MKIAISYDSDKATVTLHNRELFADVLEIAKRLDEQGYERVSRDAKLAIIKHLKDDL